MLFGKLLEIFCFVLDKDNSFGVLMLMLMLAGSFAALFIVWDSRNNNILHLDNIFVSTAAVICEICVKKFNIYSLCRCLFTLKLVRLY